MLKRTFDMLLSLLGLCFLVPVFIVIAILIKLTSKGPIFYRGSRAGLRGKLFKIYKFRTMENDAEHIGGPSTAWNDPRFTPIGKFLRMYKLDELPQLINVIKGEMSIVGPRPQVEKYTKLYNGEEKLILSVRPGLTDCASIKFINLDKILGDEQVDEKYLREIEPQKNRLRIEYVKKHSLWIDFTIIFQTLVQFLKIKSLWNTKN